MAAIHHYLSYNSFFSKSSLLPIDTDTAEPTTTHDLSPHLSFETQNNDMHLHLCLLLGALCSLGSCLPKIGEASPGAVETAHDPLAEMKSLLNVTDAQLAALNVSSLPELSAYLDRDDYDDNNNNGVVSAMGQTQLDNSRVCRNWYFGIFNRWIVQVPESWWHPKFRYGQEACEAWYREFDRTMTLAAISFWSCERRSDQYLDGWLQMRFTTTINYDSYPGEVVIARMADPRGVTADPLAIVCHSHE